MWKVFFSMTLSLKSRFHFNTYLLTYSNSFSWCRVILSAFIKLQYTMPAFVQVYIITIFPMSRHIHWILFDA